MKTLIGKKFILLLLRQSNEAYKDQFGISRSGFVLMERVEIKIVKTKTVPDSYIPKKKHKNRGWKAINDDGEIFTCNWYSYPSESKAPTYSWECPQRTLCEEYVDAIQAVRFSITNEMPIVDIDGKAAIIEGLGLCKKHKVFHLKSERYWKYELKMPVVV